MSHAFQTDLYVDWARWYPGLAYFYDFVEDQAFVSPRWILYHSKTERDDALFWMDAADRQRMGGLLAEFREKGEPTGVSYLAAGNGRQIEERWEPVYDRNGGIRGLMARAESDLQEPMEAMERALATAARPIRMTGSVLETDGRKRTEEKLRLQGLELEEATRKANQASRAKSEFLAIVSHELRTPIMGMQGGLEILEEVFDDSPDHREIFEIVKGCSESLKHLINNMLDISKLETGQLEVRREAVRLREVVEQAVDGLRSRAEEKNLVLLSEIERECPEEILNDPERIRQILENLISNALKFTQVGEIQVRVGGKTEGWVEFQVSDSGIGIDPRDTERIFQPFEQAEASSTRQYGGVGLGLTISRRLARAMGGELSVHSALGSGSVFKLTLPCGDEAAEFPGRRSG